MLVFDQLLVLFFFFFFLSTLSRKQLLRMLMKRSKFESKFITLIDGARPDLAGRRKKSPVILCNTNIASSQWDNVKEVR